MLTTAIADKILRSVYLGVVSTNINTKSHPLYNYIETDSSHVVGKDAIATFRNGINGGVGCGAEDGTLPKSSPLSFSEFKATLCNMYGNIEFTDKVLRAAGGSSSAIVNVLNHELDSLLESAKHNFGRMVQQNGSGRLAKVVDGTKPAGTILVDSLKNIIEGMVVDAIYGGTAIKSGLKVSTIDRDAKTIKFDTPLVSEIEPGMDICVQNSYNKELFGIPYVFDSTLTALYGLSRSASYLQPVTCNVNTLDSGVIQTALDKIEEKGNSGADFIITSYSMRRRYLDSLVASRINVDYLNLDGGFKSITYNGIPIYCDKFCDENTMYVLNTEDFKLFQLGDWSWIESQTGNVLRPIDNKPAYAATIVKYANMICVRPMNQCRIVYSDK